MRCKELINWYRKNGIPVVCRYCGHKNDLSKDHVIPKCKIPQADRVLKWKNKDKDPETYFTQFSITCRRCNGAKGSMGHEEFLIHIKKMASYVIK